MSSDFDNIAPTANGVVIALGANLGHPIEQLRAAVLRVAGICSGPIQCSSVWETVPVDCPPGSPRFANAIVCATAPAGVSPIEWLDQFQAWEREAGRGPKRVHNEARPLDLDIIAWGRQIWDTPRLVLPHPRAHLRRFVLEPLAELLPHWVLPGQTASVAELLRMLPPEPAFRRWLTATELQRGPSEATENGFESKPDISSH